MSYLIIRSGVFRCALPLPHVVETMRPQLVRPLANAPEFVTGVSVIRGEPLPVVCVALLLGTPAEKPARFVIVRSGGRKVALAVEAVVGIHTLAPETLAKVPGLLSEAHAGIIAAIGALDKELLLVLQAAHIISDEVWSSLAGLEVR